MTTSTYHRQLAEAETAMKAADGEVDPSVDYRAEAEAVVREWRAMRRAAHARSALMEWLFDRDPPPLTPRGVALFGLEQAEGCLACNGSPSAGPEDPANPDTNDLTAEDLGAPTPKPRTRRAKQGMN